MRTIRTFILRLLVNTAEPHALRGAVQSMPEGDPQPFADEETLLAALRRLISPSGEPPPSDEEQGRRR